MSFRALLAVIVLLLAIDHVAAGQADLAKTDRTIAKEPAYKNKPKYCLLVFGPTANHRVWLALDGDVLYVDREKVLCEKSDRDEEGEYTFKLRELRAGERRHRDLYVSTVKLKRFAESDKRAKAIVDKDPQARTCVIMISIDMPGWKGTGVGNRVQQRASFSDANGYLQFADHPKDAPIVHFDGPLEISTDTIEMKIGRETDFNVAVGSPGMGPGTHSWIDYEGAIPEKFYPTVEILYPSKNVGDPPLREKYELKERC